MPHGLGVSLFRAVDLFEMTPCCLSAGRSSKLLRLSSPLAPIIHRILYCPQNRGGSLVATGKESERVPETESFMITCTGLPTRARRSERGERDAVHPAGGTGDDRRSL